MTEDRDHLTVDEVRAAFTEYQRAYQTISGHALADLALFCRANSNCVAARPGEPVDVHRTMILEGRREVWLRIQRYRDLTIDQLFSMRATILETDDVA